MLFYVLRGPNIKIKGIKRGRMAGNAFVLAVLVMSFICMVLLWQYQDFREQAIFEQRQVQEMRRRTQSNLKMARESQGQGQPKRNEAVSSLEFPGKNR